MSTIVIMPGGFHPFHAGHMSLYNSAKKAFPDADLYVAATDSQSERPFPFAIKEKLAKVAGVQQGRFVQVKSPFQSKEITQNYNPEQDVLIFVRSEKDRNESPKPGGMKKDGTPAYFQPYDAENLQPFGKHAYFAYLPTVKFGPGITSATEIRKAWPTLDDRRKTAMVMSLYPATQKNLKLAQVVVKLLDAGMGTQSVDEGWSQKYKSSINCSNPKGFSQKAHCAGKNESIEEDWQKANRKDKTSGMSKKAVSAYRRENPGSKLKTAVTTKPSKLKAGSKAAKRRKSFCARMSGNKGPMKKPNGKPTPKALALRRWNCESVEEMQALVLLAEQKIALMKQGVAEGEVVPFARKPQPKLTWQQVPKDVLLLASDWYWADYETGSLDAVLDPKGYGNGTNNEVQYIAAKLQQKGWAIDHNDENDPRMGPFNLILTSKLGQSVLLPARDAEDFTGWAAGTRPSMREGDENTYRRPTTGEANRTAQQTQAKMNPTASKFVWKKPNQIGGSFSEQDLIANGFKKSQYNSWGGTQQMWSRLSENSLPENDDYIEEK